MYSFRQLASTLGINSSSLRCCAFDCMSNISYEGTILTRREDFSVGCGTRWHGLSVGLGPDGRATRVINKAVTNWLAVVDAWCFYSAARLLGIRGASPWCPFQATACKYYLKSSLYTGLTSLEMSICLTTYNLVQKQWQTILLSLHLAESLINNGTGNGYERRGH